MTCVNYSSMQLICAPRHCLGTFVLQIGYDTCSYSSGCVVVSTVICYLSYTETQSYMYMYM